MCCIVSNKSRLTFFFFDRQIPFFSLQSLRVFFSGYDLVCIFCCTLKNIFYTRNRARPCSDNWGSTPLPFSTRRTSCTASPFQPPSKNRRGRGIPPASITARRRSEPVRHAFPPAGRSGCLGPLPVFGIGLWTGGDLHPSTQKNLRACAAHTFRPCRISVRYPRRVTGYFFERGASRPD